VIQDVDDTLKELLVKQVPIDTSVIDIKFEMPTRDWSAAVSKPTVNVYLYDVRENHELRNTNDRFVTKVGDDHFAGRGAVRVDLSYMISVWTSDISDEHQLLGSILTTLLRFPILPDEVLKGSLATQQFAPQAWIAQPERVPNSWDFWGHLEHRMKSGLSYVITAAIEPFAATGVKLVGETLTIAHNSPKRNPPSPN
jgi:hypothetical protein